MIPERDFLFLVTFAGMLFLAFLAAGFYVLFVVRPMLRRLQKERASLEEVGREMGFQITTKYKRTFAFGTYKGRQYVFWGPFVKTLGFSSSYEFILAIRTPVSGRSHVATMFGADLAKEVWGDVAQFVEITKVIPSDHSADRIRIAMEDLARQ